MFTLLIGVLLSVTPARALEIREDLQQTYFSTVPGFALEDFGRAQAWMNSTALHPLDDAFAPNLAWVRVQLGGAALLDAHWRFEGGRDGRPPANDHPFYALTAARGTVAYALLLDRVGSFRETLFDDGGGIRVSRDHRLAHGEMHVFAALLYLAYVTAPAQHLVRAETPRFDFELPRDERRKRMARYADVLDHLLRLDLGDMFDDGQRGWLTDLRGDLRGHLADHPPRAAGWGCDGLELNR